MKDRSIFHTYTREYGHTKSKLEQWALFEFDLATNEPFTFQRLDLSGNELSVEVSKEIVRQIQFIPGFEKLKIGPNCFGSQFDSFVNFANPFCFVDAGTERFVLYIFNFISD